MANPLFVLAAPRSFTSLFCGMLGQHPQMYGLPELNLFMVEKLSDLWQINTAKFGFANNRRHGLLRAVAELYAGEQTSEAVDMASHWCAAREKLSGAETFTVLVDRLDPLIAIDKSPIYTVEERFLHRIIDACPEARFIHLVRNPVSQGASVMKLHDGAFALAANSIEYLEDEAVLDPQIGWHDINANIQEFLYARVPASNWTLVRGEEVVAEPREKLGAICNWLGIRDDEVAIQAMMHPEASPYACLGPINALYGNDPNYLRGAAFRPHKPASPPLDSPLFWRRNEASLHPQVAELARGFGYR